MKRKRKFEIPLDLIGLEEDNYHLLVKSEIRNYGEAYWILDTGASKSVFDVALESCYTPVSKAGIQINSTGIGSDPIETTIGILHPVLFSSFEINDFLVALIDLGPVNSIYGQFVDKQIAGLLGSDFLQQHHAIINYRKKTLTLYR
jgi:hypothetical protein